MTADRRAPTHACERQGSTDEPCRTWQMILPTAAHSAGLARQATRETLDSWRCEDLAETAVLLVTELVANVVRHARATTAMRLRLHACRSGLLIEVHDGDPCHPRPRTPAALDESGFGFVLVEALADKWGVRETPLGKAVWAELDAAYGDDTAPTVPLPRGCHGTGFPAC
jgi:anti-sigma regulatory factor (Ser/Thr protein kinase)